MRLLLILISCSSIIVFTACFSRAENYWAKYFQKNSWGSIGSVQQTTDGGYILIGESNIAKYGSVNKDIWVIKLDMSGNLSWQKTYGGKENEEASSIQHDAGGGGYILAGRTESFGDGSWDVFVIKLDLSGNIIWQKIYGGEGWEQASSLQLTDDGGYILAGSTTSFGAGSGDIWVVKLDNNGNIVWQKTYGGRKTDDVRSIKQTPDGGYIVAGRTYSFGIGTGYHNIWILKLDNNGNVMWEKVYIGEDSDSSVSIHQTSESGFFVAGSTESFGAGERDIFLLKLDESGNILRQKTYGGKFYDFATSVVHTRDEEFVVVGQCSRDSCIFKINNRGNISWQKTYGGDIEILAHSGHLTADGEIVVVGSINSRDDLIMKLNSIGEIPDSNCDIVKVSDLSVFDANFVSQNSNGITQSTTVTILEADFTVLDSDAEMSFVCCYDANDIDSDGIGDVCGDNCQFLFNPNQVDSDRDGLGNFCDDDIDGDTITNEEDNCVFYQNSDQEDSDKDTFGDICDNCPNISNPDQTDTEGDNIGDICDDSPTFFDPMFSIGTGYFNSGYCCYPVVMRDFSCDNFSGIHNGIIVGSEYGYISMQCEEFYAKKTSIIEFDISSIGDLFKSRTSKAHLFLTVKESGLSRDNCLTLYDIQDGNENGIIEEVDENATDVIGQICKRLQPGDTIIFDVTSSIKHDLFVSDQTVFSGFVLDRSREFEDYIEFFESTEWEDYIEFYDHRDFENGPRLLITEGCIINRLYGVNSEETKILRSFRDYLVNRNSVGQELVKLYYQWSPFIVNAIAADKDFNQEVKDMIDEVLPLLEVRDENEETISVRKLHHFNLNHTNR